MQDTVQGVFHVLMGDEFSADEGETILASINVNEAVRAGVSQVICAYPLHRGGRFRRVIRGQAVS